MRSTVLDSPFGGHGPAGRGDAPPPLLQRQQEQVRAALAELAAAEGWHAALPVLLLERCWLRLSRVDVGRLAGRLPPDGSEAAPELVRFRELVAAGLDPALAQQECWLEFGPEACQQAQTMLWRSHAPDRRDWTLDRYLALLADYRRRLRRPAPRPVPLIVLPRAGSGDPHRLHWLGERPGRCATLAADNWLSDG